MNVNVHEKDSDLPAIDEEEEKEDKFKKSRRKGKKTNQKSSGKKPSPNKSDKKPRKPNPWSISGRRVDNKRLQKK